MAKSYPHRQTVVIAIACAVAVAGTVAYVHWQTPPTQTVQPDIAAGEAGSGTSTNATIGGSSDWKKQFFGTTTGVASTAAKKAAKAADKPLTLTDQLSRDFFSQFINLKQANLTGNADIVNQTMGNMLSTDLNPIKPRTYSAADITVATASDAQSLGTFGAKVADIIGSYAATTSELAIMQNFLSGNNPATLDQFQPIMAEHRRILAGLLSLPVPRLLMGDDLELINGMSTLEAGSESLRATNIDSVKGLVGASLHADGAQSVADALSNMYKTLTFNGVLFDFHWDILNPLLN